MHYSADQNAFFMSDKNAYGDSWPNDCIEVTTDEWETYGTGNPPEGMQRGSDDDGRPRWVPIPPTPLDQLATAKRRAIDAARDEAIDAGFQHTFGKKPDTVQTGTRDRENITELAVTAQLLLASGDDKTKLPFRAASDATYQLKAADIVKLALAAQQHVSQQYGKAWALKDQLDAAVAEEDRDGIEAIAW